MIRQQVAASTSATIKGADDAASKKARNQRTQFLAEVLKQRGTATSIKLSHAIDEWFSRAEPENSTRAGPRRLHHRVIKPTLGRAALSKLGPCDLESLYAELRRCRVRCDGQAFVEHKRPATTTAPQSGCTPHSWDPMAASTVRQIHFTISSVMNAAVRWGWIDSNPAKIAKRPKQQPPQPDPPSPTEAARLIDKAFDLGDDWGTLVWLIMTPGMRRAEVAGPR